MTPTTTRVRKPAAKETAPLPDELVPKASTTGNGSAPAPGVEQSFAMLPIAAIRPGPHNPRRDLGDLEGLAASIRAVGILEPLLVEVLEPGLVVPEAVLLLAGHRRLAAAKLAAVNEVPCIIRATSATSALRMEMALVENLQREELSALDQADGFRALVDLGLSQRAIADRVGCSQALVSKRLALLDLPSHVQARITKGTMPIEAALALTKLVGHPDKLKKAAGEDPSAISQAVERAEKVIVWEAKRAELVDVAKGKGWPVVDEPSWSAKRSFATLAHWNGPPDLDIDAKKHQAEPCHAVMIPGDPPQWYSIGVPSATSVCTEPARHGPKGASTLKAKAAPKRRQPNEHEVSEARDPKDRKDAADARAAVLTRVLADHKPQTRLTPELTMVLRRVVEYGAWDTSEIAGELLALDAPPKDGRWAEVVEVYAGGGPGQLQRAALALALAATEARLRRNYGGFGVDETTEHYGYLAEHGYQPTPWEQAKVAAALAAARAD